MQENKREELEQLYADISERREVALADIATRGAVLTVTATMPKGKLFEKIIANPAVKIVTQCEKQMVEIARLMSHYSDTETPEAKPKTQLETLLGAHRDAN